MLNVQDKLLSLDFDLSSHGHQHHNLHHYITTIITINPSMSPTITITAIPHHDFLYTAIKETSSRLFSFIFMHSSFFTRHLVPVTLGREAGECYHLPKANSQTSGGKEASYVSILDQVQAQSNRFPIDRKTQLLRSYIVYMLQSSTSNHIRIF